MDIFTSNTITLSLSKEDAIMIIKCLKVAKARKTIEARHELKKGGTEWANKKFAFVTKINELTQYIEYLTK